jgi:integrase/recombinase XerD
MACVRTNALAWRQLTIGSGPVIRSERGGAMAPVSIVNWFAMAYRAVGLSGCSSHSPERNAAASLRRLPAKACSLAPDPSPLSGIR